MFTRIFPLVMVALFVLGCVISADAAPGLPITKPPVVGPPNTGPLIDPPAMRGQWFMRMDGTEEVRTHEFYDNVHDDRNPAGGGWMSYQAIQGKITQLYFDPMQNLIGFDIDATITNDLPPLSPWMPGFNSHEEQLMWDEPEEHEMLDVKLTIEFADDGVLGNFPPVGPPYFPAPPPLDVPMPGALDSNIFAINHDQLAWYCWTPDQSAPSPADGQYMVPTWDFGNIPIGQSVTRVLQFGLHMPVPPGHPLYNLIIDLTNFDDVLLNRTTSLKISHYFEMFFPDFGMPYPEEPWGGSNCSVFYNIEELEPPDPPKLWDVERFANGNIGLTWIGSPLWTYRVEESVSPYDYNEANMIWNTVANGIPGAPMMTWVDPFPPPAAGPEKYYRIYAQNGPIETICPDTAGAMIIPCNVGRNLISCMFEPYPPGGGTPGNSTLDKMIGNQLSGSFMPFFSDFIEFWNTATNNYDAAWYDISVIPGVWKDINTPGPPLFGFDADVGYWANILAFNPPQILVLCGRVSKVNRTMPVRVGRNLLGSCFPVPRQIGQMGLITSGFTGSIMVNFSDYVELWNPVISNYDMAWYNTMMAQWQDANGFPFGRPVMPGDGLWVNVLPFNTAFIWTYPLPPGMP